MNVPESIGADPNVLPVLYGEHFATELIESPDMSQTDIELEIQRLFQRNKLVDEWLSGKADIDDVADLLVDHGIDPWEWLSLGLSRMTGQ